MFVERAETNPLLFAENN